MISWKFKLEICHNNGHMCKNMIAMKSFIIEFEMIKKISLERFDKFNK